MISGSGTLEMFNVILDMAFILTVDPAVLTYHFLKGINFEKEYEERIDFIKCYNESHN